MLVFLFGVYRPSREFFTRIGTPRLLLKGCKRARATNHENVPLLRISQFYMCWIAEMLKFSKLVFFYSVQQAVFPKLALKYGIVYPEIQLSNVHDVIFFLSVLFKIFNKASLEIIYYYIS